MVLVLLPPGPRTCWQLKPARLQLPAKRLPVLCRVAATCEPGSKESTVSALTPAAYSKEQAAPGGSELAVVAGLGEELRSKQHELGLDQLLHPAGYSERTGALDKHSTPARPGGPYEQLGSVSDSPAGPRRQADSGSPGARTFDPQSRVNSRGRVESTRRAPPSWPGQPPPGRADTSEGRVSIEPPREPGSGIQPSGREELDALEARLASPAQAEPSGRQQHPRQSRPYQAGERKSSARLKVQRHWNEANGKISTIAHRIADLPPDIPVSEILQSEQAFGRHVSNLGKIVTRLLSLLDYAGARDRALEVFNWFVERDEDLRKDRFLYTRLMSTFGRDAQGAPTALEIFDRLRAAGVAPDRVAFNAAINAAGKAGLWDAAQDTYADMQAARVAPDVWTYASLLTACQVCGNRWRQALAYLNEMEQTGVAPNIVVFTSLMNLLVKAGEADVAMRVFSRLEAAGVRADIVCCNSAISACGRACKWEQAWAVFSGMRRMGVQPDSYTYNALIAACERCGQPERAMEMFRRMDADPAARPSLITFNTLLSAYGKAGCLREARNLAAEMQRRGIQPDVFTMAALVTACEKAGEWEDAVSVFAAFQRIGIEPNVVAYNSLIAALGAGGEWERALDVLEDMVEASAADPAEQVPRPRRPPPDTRPDIVTFTTLVSVLQSCGRWREALEVYQRMPELGVEASPYILDSLVSALEAAGQWERALELFQELRHRDGNAPSVTNLGRRVLYAIPPNIMKGLPPALVAAAKVAVDSGRAARAWIDSKDA